MIEYFRARTEWRIETHRSNDCSFLLCVALTCWRSAFSVWSFSCGGGVCTCYFCCWMKVAMPCHGVDSDCTNIWHQPTSQQAKQLQQQRHQLPHFERWSVLAALQDLQIAQWTRLHEDSKKTVGGKWGKLTLTCDCLWHVTVWHAGMMLHNTPNMQRCETGLIDSILSTHGNHWLVLKKHC